MRAVIFVIVVVSAVWVNVDARRLGVRRGRLGGGPYDLSVTSWVLATLVIWIVGFPGYLIARGKYQLLRATSGAGGFPSSGPGLPAGEGSWGVGGPARTVVPAQPAYMSPDGRWWWDGQRWVPVPAAAAPPTR